MPHHHEPGTSPTELNMNTGALGGQSGRLYQLRSGQSAALENDVNSAANIVDDLWPVS